MNVFIAVLPWDYTDAEVNVFRTREEAQEWINQTVEGTRKHYARIVMRDLEPRKKTEKP